MEIITLEESQLIFEDFDLLKKFLSEKYSFSADEIDILLSGSFDLSNDTMLIDIIYNAYVKLGCVGNKSDIEIKLYSKLLEILNYHIVKNNFNDKSSRFIKEFEYALLHYDELVIGNDVIDTNKRK